jgi:class 3 adenylate cyclase
VTQRELLDWTFVFVDVVGYSQQRDPEQLAIADKLCELLERVSLGREIAGGEGRVDAAGAVLPTGDGFVAAFSRVARTPQEVIEFSTAAQNYLKPWQLRIGIHAGSGYAYSDFNSRFYSARGIANNVAGDGINITQRIMSLADPGEILVSGSFVDRYTRALLGDDPEGKAQLRRTFQDLGTVQIKHGRQQPVWRFLPDGVPRIKWSARISTFQRLQERVLTTLSLILDAVRGLDRYGANLRPRAAVLLFDDTAQELFVSGYRAGEGFSERSRPSPIRFSTTQGPGRTFEKARLAADRATSSTGALTNDNEVHYYEMPDPARALDEYISFCERSTGIPASTVRGFARKSRSYVYYPLISFEDKRPFGVLSIDAMVPIFGASAVRRRASRDGRSPARTEKIVQRHVANKYKGLYGEIGPHCYALSEYWSLISGH